MTDAWQTRKLGDVFDLHYGKSLPSSKRAEGGEVNVYGSNGIIGQHNEALVEGPHIVVGRKGSVGKIHFEPRRSWPIDTTFYIPEKRGYDIRFLANLLRTLGLEGMNSDAAVPGLNRKATLSLEALFPPLDEQKRIAEALSTLEDRVHYHLQMNETLEEMARALFQDWFVDFGPTRRKMEGATDPAAIMGRAFPAEKSATVASLFPAILGEDGLPEGWVRRRTEEVASKIAMGPFGSNIKVSTFVDSGVPIISGHHLHGTLMKHGDHKFITEEHADRLKNSNVYEGDIIFTHAGTIGQVSMVGSGGGYGRYVISQRQFYLRADKSKISPLYLLLYYKSPAGQHELLANASSVGVPSIARPSSHLKGIEICLPSREVMNSFEAIVGSLFAKLIANEAENKTLAELRDLLLPKFMSGEIRVGTWRS